MSNFIQRAITGVMFAIIVVGGMILHPLTYVAIFLAVIVIGIHEFAKMTCDGESRLHLMPALLLGIFIFLHTFLVHYADVSMRWIVLVVPLAWIPFFIELFRKNPKPFRNIALTFLSTVYIVLPATTLHFLVFKDSEYASMPLLCFFILVWVNDSAAYLVGSNFGRHKLYERISPKKTMEGFLGGILFNLLAAFLIFRFTQIGTLWIWLVAALVVSIFGTAGDLIESMLKRSQNVKDSGSFLPGHGGILDRFDAALFAAPMVSLLFYYFT